MNKLAYFIILLCLLQVANASQSSGTIDATYHYASICGTDACATYSGNLINFKPTLGAGMTQVTIDDTNGLDGNSWGNVLGWINLGPSGSNALSINPNTGSISGYAWSQVAGWINFSPTGYGVSINGNGEFTGYAWASGEGGGWVKFDCSGGATTTCVKTDWRPVPFRTTIPSGGGGGGGGGFVIPNSVATTTATTTKPLNENFQSTQTGAQNQKQSDWTNLYRSDINDDTYIDLFDFNLLIVNWDKISKLDMSKGKQERCKSANIADLNCDGQVGILDFNILLINWGGRVLSS